MLPRGNTPVVPDRIVEVIREIVVERTLLVDKIYSLEEAEKAVIMANIEKYGDNFTNLAKRLSCSRDTLYRMCKVHGINFKEVRKKT